MTQLTGKNLVAGTHADGTDAVFHAVDPARNEPIAPDFHPATAIEVDRAMTAATEAFETYRATSGATRATLLEAIATEIEALGDALIERGQAETGLPAARLQGERGRTCGQLRLFAQLVREGSWVDARIDRALPDRQPLPRPDLRRMLIPLGPVVVFGASNFPLAFSVAGGDTASALAAGCTVAVKAHPAHPGTSELVGTAINRAIKTCGLPAGLFSLLHGDGPTIGVQLVKHPVTTAVGFTGSHTAGRALFDAAAARPHPIPVFAEMSSVNPVFIFPGALRANGATIAKNLLGSFTLGVGQFCTKPGLVFVPTGPETEGFLETLAAEVNQTSGGTMLTSRIQESFLGRQQAIIQSPDVKLLAAGKPGDAAHTAGQPSVAVTSAQSFIGNPALATEAFGPFTLIIRTETTAELIACARSLEGQLTATIHGDANDLSASRELIALLEQKAGRILINGFPTGVEVCPAMNHGGPYPATTDARFTSVGTAAILRFARPVCYHAMPDELLPDALRSDNPLGILRLVDGVPTRDSL